MSIPLLDLKAQLKSYRAQVLAAIEEVVDAQYFIMGPKVKAFETELGSYLGLPPAVGVSSGTDALLAALMALEIGPGDEVITTPFTFFATAGVIARLGATPVFVDIDPKTFNLTEAGVRAAITERTKAIIPVHLYGQICDLGSLVDEPGRPAIIEDAAQALGATLGGKSIGAFGDLATISFFPSKNLGAYGDGGAIVSRDEALLEKCRIIRVHGSKPKYFHHVVGGNFRLDAIQAAVLSVKLPLLDGWAAGRQRNASLYNEIFTEAGLVSRGLVQTPYVQPGAGHVYNQYVLRVKDRDGVRQSLADAGIGAMVYYPSGLHTQPCFAGLGYGPDDFPQTQLATTEVLALPIYPELQAEQLRAVGAVIQAHYKV